jgi:hypothetical protein
LRRLAVALRNAHRSDGTLHAGRDGGLAEEAAIGAIEDAKGLITQYEILKGNPSDEIHVAPSLQRHRRAFRRAPDMS